MADNAAVPSAGLAGVQRRAADSPDAKYRAFDTYPWTKDRPFTAQLASALEAAAQSPGSSLVSAALAARTARFEQQTKIKIDPAAYQAWLTANNARQPPLVPEQIVMAESMAVTDPAERRFAQLLVELGEPLGRIALQTEAQNAASGGEVASSSSPVAVPQASEADAEVDGTVPSWQAAAPKAELYVPRDVDSSGGSGGGKEQYPKKFMEIVEFIQTGKPIEGIRKIPDTVVEDPSISTTGKMQAPLKPWERRAAASSGDASSAMATETSS
ncbi:uncharacterized protein B0I36DRAFT_28834 [Microdochium trichocladiopsis]|uniref:Uncharacterized protein n=1 Tax=Microdochium trichocladiopsis TaxID=1682393 RepID=A0A9P9BKC9_9PEZI|nr:uncharacterized protein B0I36DRAFT_28834 [Microdochium trichocladiopsis]KAH7021089.1 hypothetical protein B0I36DRAFT_28834 [Microdochium trichocladiopsis]